MSTDADWGGPKSCHRCGHPAVYHGAAFCQVDAGSDRKRPCDCSGWLARPEPPAPAKHGPKCHEDIRHHWAADEGLPEPPAPEPAPIHRAVGHGEGSDGDIRVTATCWDDGTITLETDRVAPEPAE